jgi:hypothetical protein
MSKKLLVVLSVLMVVVLMTNPSMQLAGPGLKEQQKNSALKLNTSNLSRPLITKST